MEQIFPRSPRESMDGWCYLPRYVDKLRLHHAGKLHADYIENLTVGYFDALWLSSAGVDAATFIDVVRRSITDGEVCDWVHRHVKKSDQEKATHREKVMVHGTQNEQVRARLTMRKEQAGIASRDDIRTFVDYIDADEGRL